MPAHSRFTPRVFVRFRRFVAAALCMAQLTFILPALTGLGATRAEASGRASAPAAKANTLTPQSAPNEAAATRSLSPEALRAKKDITTQDNVSPSSPQVMTCTTLGVQCVSLTLRLGFPELSVAGRGVPLNFNLAYNDTLAPTLLGMAQGWTHNYQLKVVLDPSTYDATVLQEDGSYDVFNCPNPGTPCTNYIAPPSVLATLTLNANGTWTFYRKKEAITYQFNAQGMLLSQTDRNGYTTTVSYNAGGYITQVADSAGRKLLLSHVWLPYANNNAGAWQIKTVMDPLGQMITLNYYSNGELSDVTDVNGNTTHFTYMNGTSNFLATITDPRGNLTTYHRGGSIGIQIDWVQTPMGKTTFVQSAPNGVIASVTVTDPAGNVSVATYGNTPGGGFNILTYTKGVTAGWVPASVWKYQYDGANSPVQGLGVVTQVTDPNGHIWYYAYDANANVTGRLDPLFHPTTAAYNAFNEPLWVKDATGVTTTMSYDSHGNLLSTSRPLTATGETALTTLQYNDAAHPGDATSRTDALGRVWSTHYDAYGNVDSTTSPLSDRTTFGYDLIGRKVWAVSGNGNAAGAPAGSYKTTYTYNAPGTAASLTVTDPLGHQATTTYDASGNVATTTDGNGNKTSYAYNGVNEVTQIVRADGSVLNKGYHPDGLLYYTQDGANHTSYYYQDNHGRLNTVVDPLGRATYYAYDPAGNRTLIYDAMGKSTTITYDAANELTAVTYSDGTPSVTNIQYDAIGKRTAMTDGSGTSTWKYDSLNRLTYAQNGALQTSQYTYYLDGHPKTISYPSGLVAVDYYDGAGRLQFVSDGTRLAAGFGYDHDSELTAVSYANSVSTAITRSATDAVMNIRHTNPNLYGGSAFSNFSYTRDGNDQLVSRAETGPVYNVRETYTYTKLNQLASDNGVTYAYDAADNPVKALDGTIQVFDAANQICWSALNYAGLQACGSKPSTAATFAYDPLGRRTQVAPPGQSLQERVRSPRTLTMQPAGLQSVQPIQRLGVDIARAAQPGSGSGAELKRPQSVTSVDVKYAYDQASHLTQYGNPTKATYAYDGDGMRIAKAVIGGTASSTAKPFSQKRVPAGHAYPVSRLRKSIATGASYYAWSGVGGGGSAKLLEEDTAAGATEYIYGPGGMLIEQIGPNGSALFFHPDFHGSTRVLTDIYGQLQAVYDYDPYGNITVRVENGGFRNPMGYVGEYTDRESNLLYLRARYYEPNSGQFLTVDPLVATTHSPYDYVYDSPLNATDPSGACSWCVAAAIGFAVGAASSIVVQHYIEHKKINWTDVAISGAAGAISFGFIATAPAGAPLLATLPRTLLASSAASAGNNVAQQWENDGHSFGHYSPLNTAQATAFSFGATIAVAGLNLGPAIPGTTNGGAQVGVTWGGLGTSLVSRGVGNALLPGSSSGAHGNYRPPTPNANSWDAGTANVVPYTDDNGMNPPLSTRGPQ